MVENRGSGLVPPQDLRPAQLGVMVVGRVILGHVGATVADLAQRGYLELREVPGVEGDWVLTDLRGRASHDGAGLLRFEATLLDGLFAGRPSVRLAERGPELVPVLARVRSQIIRDAVRRGWVRRWRHDRRTRRGDEVLARAQTFRRELRALAAAGGHDQLASVAPYAMIFGLAVPPPVAGPDGHGGPTPRRPEPAVPWAGMDRFATSWLGAFAACSAAPGRGPGRRASGADFARDWSASHDHHHAADHSQAAYGTDYGHAGDSHAATGGGHAGL